MTDSNDTSTEHEDESVLDHVHYTKAEAPPVKRPSKWEAFLADLEERGRDPEQEEDKATLGPFDSPERAYSIASRISNGRFPGAEPAGKFLAKARTLKFEEVDDSGDVTVVKRTVVWAKLNPEFVADPTKFASNGDSDLDNVVAAMTDSA